MITGTNKFRVVTFLIGIILPIFLWIIFSPWSAELDLKTSHLFFKDGAFNSNPFWNWLFVYGVWPAWILFGFAVIGIILSYAKKSYHYLRLPCFYLFLTYALSSGLIIHGILKDHWGRPRPKQTIEFGGTQPFRPYYQPNFNNQPVPSKSFTCGHCSMGFYFFTLTLLGIIYRSKILFWIGLILAFGLGILLSMTRLAQGGHFLSDTLASAIIMWLTAWCLAFILFKKQRTDERINEQTI